MVQQLIRRQAKDACEQVYLRPTDTDSQLLS